MLNQAPQNINAKMQAVIELVTDYMDLEGVDYSLFGKENTTVVFEGKGMLTISRASHNTVLITMESRFPGLKCRASEKMQGSAQDIEAFIMENFLEGIISSL